MLSCKYSRKPYHNSSSATFWNCAIGVPYFICCSMSILQDSLHEWSPLNRKKFLLRSTVASNLRPQTLYPHLDFSSVSQVRISLLSLLQPTLTDFFLSTMSIVSRDHITTHKTDTSNLNKQQAINKPPIGTLPRHNIIRHVFQVASSHVISSQANLPRFKGHARAIPPAGNEQKAGRVQRPSIHRKLGTWGER